MNLKIQHKQSLSTQLLSQWEQLWKSSSDAHFYNAPTWFLLWRDLHKDNEYLIVTAFENKELVGILPLVKERRYGVPVYTQPFSAISDKPSLLTRSPLDSTHHHIVAYLAKNVSFYLPAVDERYIKSQVFSFGTYVKETSLNAYLPLTQDPFKLMDKKQKNKIVNKQKRYASNISHKIFKGDSEALSTVFAIEEKSIKYEKGIATFTSKTMREFIAAAIQRVSDKVEIDILYYDTIPVVSSIGFRANNTFHAFHTAYDASYRFLSPGKLLLFFIIQRLMKEKVNLIDLGREYNTLKRDFTPFYRSQYDIFATQNKFAVLWWNSLQRTRTEIVENKLLYGFYCRLKKIRYSL